MRGRAGEEGDHRLRAHRIPDRLSWECPEGGREIAVSLDLPYLGRHWILQELRTLLPRPGSGPRGPRRQGCIAAARGPSRQAGWFMRTERRLGTGLPVHV